MTTTDPTTTPVLTTPIVVDYTNRDFYSLRDALIAQVKDRVNTGTTSKWYGNDATDFGVALVEAFAYMGDVVNYYIDRVANENNILTATQRESITNLALTYGYVPSGYQAALSTITFNNPNSISGLPTLPAGTQVTGSVVDGDVVRQIVFTTTEAAVLPSSGSISVQAQHGYNITSVYPASNSSDVAGEVIGTSNGTPLQIFKLGENQVVDGTIKVLIQVGDTYGEWTQVLHLADYGPTDAVYRLVTDSDNNVYIRFGDGVSGAIPNTYATIKAQYLVGGGVLGNVAANTLTGWGYIPSLTTVQASAIKAAITISNGIAVGGTDPESIDSIRLNAPLAYAATNRAVTLGDFTGLAIQVETVGKANAQAALWNSVTLYVAPRRDGVLVSSTDVYPGKDATNTSVTTVWTDIQTQVQNELASKLLIGTSLTVAPPTYTDVYLDIVYTLISGFDATQVETSIRQFLNTYYSYNQMSFAQTLYPQSIEGILQYVPGISNVKVRKLYRSGGVQIASTLVGAANEIFVLQGSSTTFVTLSTSSTDSSLSALALANGATSLTLTPAFSSTTYSYTTTASGATTISVTPTNTHNALIAIEGTVTSSGATRGVIMPATPKTVTNVVAASGKVTYTLSTTHTFVVGDVVTITGVSPTGYNLATQTITAVGTNTITITNGATGTYTSGGSVALNKHTINTVLISEDGSTTKTYAVTVTV